VANVGDSLALLVNLTRWVCHGCVLRVGGGVDSGFVPQDEKVSRQTRRGLEACRLDV
jgi:hypothetical protein